MKLNVVLVEPEIPANTGNISRTCALTGAALHLIGPMGFEITDKRLKRAGLDYWNMLDLHYYNNLEVFLKRIRRIAKISFTIPQRPGTVSVKFLIPIMPIFFLEKKQRVSPKSFYLKIRIQQYAYLCLTIPMPVLSICQIPLQ